MNYILNWRLGLNKYYKNGSFLSYQNNGTVLFENNFLFPGASIISWDSRDRYYIIRGAVQLPLLKRKYKYIITPHLVTFPENSILFKISFYDRISKEISSIFIPSEGGEFVFPFEAYDYSIEIVSLGLKKLEFQKIIISDFKE